MSIRPKKYVLYIKRLDSYHAVCEWFLGLLLDSQRFSNTLSVHFWNPMIYLWLIAIFRIFLASIVYVHLFFLLSYNSYCYTWQKSHFCETLVKSKYLCQPSWFHLGLYRPSSGSGHQVTIADVVARWLG